MFDSSLTFREREILTLLQQNPLIPQQTLADRLGISRSAVAGHIMNLMHKGYVRGKGYILAEQRYAVIIGGANMDICGTAYAPLRPGDSNPGSIQCSPGGAARNIAENLGRLGVTCYLISLVGDDLYGKSLLEITQRAGVDIRACQIMPQTSTSTYLSLHGPDGDMTLAMNDMESLTKLTPDYLLGHRELLRHAGVIIIDANLAPETLAWLFTHYANLPLFVDPVSAFKAERLRPWLQHIHTLKPNHIEASTLSGIPLTGPDDAPTVATWFHEQGIQRVVLSLAAHGLYYSEREGEAGWRPPPKVNVINTTGAGDALMAGLAYRWLADDSFADSLHFALGCAALTLMSSSTNNTMLSPLTVTQWLTHSLTQSVT